MKSYETRRDCQLTPKVLAIGRYAWVGKAKHCPRVKHQQVSKSNGLTRSFSAIFSDFLLEVASAFNERLCSPVISVLDSFLYCMLLPSKGDKLTKVTCKDPWQPEVKMKGMERRWCLYFEALYTFSALQALKSPL